MTNFWLFFSSNGKVRRKIVFRRLAGFGILFFRQILSSKQENKHYVRNWRVFQSKQKLRPHTENAPIMDQKIAATLKSFFGNRTDYSSPTTSRERIASSFMFGRNLPRNIFYVNKKISLNLPSPNLDNFFKKNHNHTFWHCFVLPLLPLLPILPLYKYMRNEEGTNEILSSYFYQLGNFLPNLLEENEEDVGSTNFRRGTCSCHRELGREERCR